MRERLDNYGINRSGKRPHEKKRKNIKEHSVCFRPDISKSSGTGTEMKING